jgi:large subunit ribosomal protein L16
MVHPRRTKYRKMFGDLVTVKGRELKMVLPTFGVFGLRIDESGLLSEAQIEAARKTVKKILKKQAKIWLNVCATISVTTKPAEVRMGRGKGGHEFWATKVKTGKLIIEVQRLRRKLTDNLIRRALQMGGSKLPVKTSVIIYKV